MAVDPLLYLSMLVIALALALAVVVRTYADRVSKLKERVRDLEGSKQSLSTTYGRITEQWAPFMAGYPYEPKNFRFIGSPIDGIQFENDKLVFVEFKTNTSGLSNGQRRIRQLVEQGRIEWLEFRLESRESVTAAPPPKTDIEQWGAERAP